MNEPKILEDINIEIGALPIAIAQLNLLPEDLERRAGIHFRDSSDGLDFFRCCVFKHKKFNLISLIRYKGDIGTNIYIENKLSSGDLEELLSDLREFLRFKDEDITWINLEWGCE